MLRSTQGGFATYHGGVSKATTPAVLSARELSVWRMFLRAHASIIRRLEHDLVAEHGLPLASYDVLLQLAESPQRRLRMTDLADRVLLSRSGLTRLVDRLAAEGLVQRESCPSDARGTFTVLTEAGLDRLRETAPTHLSGVEAYVTSRLAPAELDQLGLLLRKLLPENEVTGPDDRDAIDGIDALSAPASAGS